MKKLSTKRGFLVNEQQASVPDSYRKWQLRARGLIEPLIGLMEPGRASLPIDGPASDHDENADRLEAFARPLLLLSHWNRSLAVYSDDEDEKLAAPARKWFKEALLLGTNPDEEEFFGYSANFHQHSVEMGLLVIALELSRDWLWEPLGSEERDQVLSWLESDAGNGHHWNNHMFFGIFVLEFLLREGRGFPSYRVVIDRWFAELDGMYHGDGWFMDGMNQAFDFYNAYAWHYYSSWWALLYGEADTDRCQRWAIHTRRFLEDYPRFFAASGEHPAFGRSIGYRFNATAPFGVAQLAGISPVDPGLSRELCQRNLDFFLSRPIFQRQGCLSLGWHDKFPDMVESYSCGGSPYWAAKAFAPLLLSPDDAFWSAPAKPLPSEEGETATALPVPSLIVRSVQGDVEIINAGSQIASTNTRFGPYKWGHLSYRSGFGFLISRDPKRYPFDSGLTAEDPSSGCVHGRHYTAPIAVEENHMGCLYSLGRKQEQFQVSVETHLWWRGGWQLAVHRYISKGSATLRHGGYALPGIDPSKFRVERSGDWSLASYTSQSVGLQPLHGFERFGSSDRLSDEDGPRSHIQGPYHSLSMLERDVARGESGYLGCLSWAGSSNEDVSPWKVVSLSEHCWILEHELAGKWEVKNAFLPEIGERNAFLLD